MCVCPKEKPVKVVVVVSAWLLCLCCAVHMWVGGLAGPPDSSCVLLHGDFWAFESSVIGTSNQVHGPTVAVSGRPPTVAPVFLAASCVNENMHHGAGPGDGLPWTSWAGPPPCNGQHTYKTHTHSVFPLSHHSPPLPALLPPRRRPRLPLLPMPAQVGVAVPSLSWWRRRWPCWDGSDWLSVALRSGPISASVCMSR